MGEDAGTGDEATGDEGPGAAACRGDGDDPPAPDGGGDERAEPYRAVAGKHCDAQMQRRPKRKLFDAAAKEDFLGWYAASGNCAWAAEKAGFDDGTVWRHRASDPDFDEACERAYHRGIARAKVTMLEAKMRRRPYRFDADREVPDFEVDPEIAMKLIAGHERAQGLAPGRRGKQGRTPRVATNEEVEAALARRLAAYARRVAGAGGGGAEARVRPDGGEAEGGARTPPSALRAATSPANAGED